MLMKTVIREEVKNYMSSSLVLMRQLNSTTVDTFMWEESRKQMQQHMFDGIFGCCYIKINKQQLNELRSVENMTDDVVYFQCLKNAHYFIFFAIGVTQQVSAPKSWQLAS